MVAGACFSNLDRLKVINDPLGHSLADELLLRIAAAFEKYGQGREGPVKSAGWRVNS